jgi:exodeoxyribonuclease VII large subunit
VNKEKNRLVVYHQRMMSAVYQALAREKGKLNLWQKTVELHSPERIYRMGYSLTTVNGKVVRGAQDVAEGDVIETHLRDGVIQSEVK